MKEDYNDMQEFLKNSMEQFNSSPSSDVWENIDSQLSASMPFYKKWFFWGALALSLLLITLFGTTFNLYQTNQDLLIKSNAALEENLLLHKEIDQLNNSLSRTQSNLDREQTARLEIESQLKSNSPINQADRHYVSNSQLINKDITKNVDGLTQQFTSHRFRASMSDNVNSPFFPRSTLHGPEESVLSNNIILNKPLDHEEVEMRDLWTKSIPPLSLKSLAHTTSNTSSSSINSMPPPLESSFKEKDIWMRKLELQSLLQNIKSSLSFDPSFETPKGWHWYRFGILTGVHTTWTDLGKQWDAGYTVGLSNEVILNKKLGLTFDFRYNSQQYRFDVNDSNINSISDYPRAPSAQSIEDIEVKSRYFDLPIGLSYAVPLSRKLKLRINPALAWQVYLPQKYEYNIGENVKFGNVEERYFLYLGSAHLNLDIERKLNADVAWRIGLWGEVGLIPLGIERRKIRMFGIKSAIIFGKS